LTKLRTWVIVPPMAGRKTVLGEYFWWCEVKEKLDIPGVWFIYKGTSKKKWVLAKTTGRLLGNVLPVQIIEPKQEQLALAIDNIKKFSVVPENSKLEIVEILYGK
jgi:hypothetical protein